MLIDRRRLILTGTLGLGAYAIPGFAQTAPAARTGFTHNVASGEPASDSMLFWTRFAPASGDTARVKLEVSETADFARPVAGGEVVTGAWRDWTVKVTAAGLKPATRYHYRFVGPDGSFSPVGQTRTLPVGAARQWKAAIFSCSNLPYGYFNAYDHAAAREDIDCAIHLGDYLYEHKPGVYPSAAEGVAERLAGIAPDAEMVHLADYRLRFASYRADPDLAALHAAMPMIAQWDDHESTNDSWEGGAGNHQPATEGDWGARKAASMQAYREWMPVSEAPWASYDVGDLATFFRTDMRLSGRSAQHDFADILKGQADPARALAAFRDGLWIDPAATMMGTDQEAWLAAALKRSSAERRRWQVVQSGTLVGTLASPPNARDFLKPDASAGTRAWIDGGVLAGKLGLPNNLDSWGGYPAARRRLLQSAQDAAANLLVISGDSHNAWAFDLAQDGRAVGAEFGGTSVTSAGYESALGVAPETVARALVATNRELKWCDTSRRGYMTLTLEPERATNEWWMNDTIRTRSPRAAVAHTATVLRGRNRMSA
jgi:alkaline phosphatase D